MLLGVTVHWAEVYLRIWEEHFPQWRGDTQAPSNRKSRIPTAVIGGCSWCVLLSQQVDKGVVNLVGLPRLPEQGFGGRDRRDVRTADRWASQWARVCLEPTIMCRITRVRVATSLYR